jgi:hypothetical protein
MKNPATESPIMKKEIKEFLASNQKIKDALGLFGISAEQYAKAMQSVEPRPTTSNEVTIELEV